MASALISNAKLASKFRGCIVGALMGDCLGHPFEGDVHVSKSVLRNFFTKLLSGESSQIFPFSDDTCMTLSVASSLIDKGRLDATDMAIKFVKEYFSQPQKGYGANVVDVFQALRDTNFEDVFLPAKLQFGGSGSYGNGGAMRISPIALFGHNKGPEFIVAKAEECARITHTHKNGYNGAILQCLAVNAALKSDPSEELNSSKFIDDLLEKMESIEKVNISDKRVREEKKKLGVILPNKWGKDETKVYCESLKKIKQIYLGKFEDISSEEIAEYLGNDVSAQRSVPTAIFSFLRGLKPLKEFENSNPFLRTLYFALSVGGDTDTIASMAGAIAGAYHSAEFIPEVLQKRCEFIDGVTKIADKLFDASK